MIDMKSAVPSLGSGLIFNQIKLFAVHWQTNSDMDVVENVIRSELAGVVPRDFRTAIPRQPVTKNQ